MDPEKSPMRWSAPEFDASADSRAIILFLCIFLGVTIYALVENSPIMAITFVLLGTVILLHSRKPAKILTCSITENGIVIGREFYSFDNIVSFWIIYKPEEQSLFLKTKASLVSSVRVPLGDTSPNDLRETLLRNVREVKYEPTVIDTLSRFLHI